MRPVQRILVPIDASGESDAACDCARYFAAAMEASVTVLHVYEPPSALSAIVPGADRENDLDREQRRARALVDAAASRLRAAGLGEVLTAVVAGHPVAAILHEATGYDLIVMGTHGRKGLDRLVMGSVAEGVLRSAPCPVVTVHLPPGV